MEETMEELKRRSLNLEIIMILNCNIKKIFLIDYIIYKSFLISKLNSL